MKKLFFLILFIIHTSISLADVLFIDLNNVELEIKVAREAAKLRGEKLIVLPLNRDAYKDPIRVKLVKQAEETYNRIEKICNTDRPTPKCNQAYKEVDLIEEKIQKLPPAKQYSAEKLQEELKTVKEKINSIMISGHDGGGDFYGEFGSIYGDGFLDTLKNYSGRADVKSLYLLGCNSATTHTLTALWKAALPNANFIAGYEGIGYLRDNGLGHTFIKKVMAEEQNIVAAKNMSEALKKFRIVSPSDKSHGTAACVVLNTEPNEPIYLSSTQPAATFGELFNCPKEITEKISRFLKCALSEDSPCPLNPEVMEILKIAGNLEKCNFRFSDVLDDVTKIQNKLYFLANLVATHSHFSTKTIFDMAPEKLLKELNINPSELTTYSKIKEKILALRNHYEEKFNFNSIKDMPLAELTKRASEKKHFDTAWIAVSNLDLSTANKLYYASRESGAGGDLRAQAFYKALKSGETVGTYQERIELLAKEKQGTTDTLTAINLDQEIKRLKQYQSEKL